MMKVTVHRGIEIYVDPETSVFFTNENETELGRLESLTIKGLKSMIDTAGKKKAERIPGFMLGERYYSSRGGNKIREVVVTSVITNESRYGGGRVECWVIQKGGGRSKERAETVYRDTPENRALAEEWVRQKSLELMHAKEADKLQDKMRSFKS